MNYVQSRRSPKILKSNFRAIILIAAVLMLSVTSAQSVENEGTHHVSSEIVTILYADSDEWGSQARWPVHKQDDPACPENPRDLSFLIGIRIDVEHGREWGHETYEIAYFDPPDWINSAKTSFSEANTAPENRRYVRVRRIALTPESSEALLDHLTEDHRSNNPKQTIAPSALRFMVIESASQYLHELVRKWEHGTRIALGNNMAEFHCADCTEYRVEVSDCSFFKYSTTLTSSDKPTPQTFIEALDRALGYVPPVQSP